MKHFNPRLIIPIILILLFGGGGWYIDAQRSRERSVLSGYFESQPTEVASRIEGRVARILVQEGDTVASGQPLVEMSAIPTLETKKANEASREQAQQQLLEAQHGPRAEDIRKQQAMVAEAAANLRKLHNGPLPEDIASARARVEQTEANLRKLRAGARPEEIAEARAAAQNAEARLRQAERGLTDEEKAQAKARLDSALASEALEEKEAERMSSLLDQGAISREQWDKTQADLRTAVAKRQEMEQAYRLAITGTPPEEMEQFRQAYRQAKAALDLVLAGSRKEDIEAASADVAQAKDALALLLRGSRVEDIQAAQAHLNQEQAALDALLAGSRKEEIAQLQAAAKAADARARSAESDLSERKVLAPEQGVVERVLVAVGDLVSPRSPIVRMSNPRDIWLRIYVPEAELSKVSVGEAAQLHVDGLPEPVDMYVESVSSQGEFTPANLQTPSDRGKQVYSVRLRPRQYDPRLKAGMAATVKRIGRWEP
ncbi:MAG TPA: HlyD family efflux transporter periplasmic adaptor subunit [Chthonomonadaceae bacterium]|nr:HlyD family efflux transporter periplasmic adaptor subunit [Chthonomonadaceae bacterium]